MQNARLHGLNAKKEVTWINKDQFSSEAEILEEMVTKLKEKSIIPN